MCRGRSIFTVLTLCGLFSARLCYCGNNVCATYEDYRNMDNNTNCWYNPDIDSTPEVMAQNYGFSFENHTVISKDHYHVTLFRIQNQNSAKLKQPVLVHHGLFSTGLGFMTSGDRSLAFFLAERGYDVWLINARGTPYSSFHSYLNISDSKYWNFSFHEMALNDLPASLEHINKITGKRFKIIYIGHSMGTTISFIYSSLKKNHAKKFLKSIVSIAPVASLQRYTSSLQHLVPAARDVLIGLKSDNISVLFPFPKRQHKILSKVCSSYPTIGLCVLTILITQGDSDELLPQDVPVVFSSHPARTSLKTFQHFVQIAAAGRFQHFDYGVEENLKVYNSTEPPLYPMANIGLPVHLFYARNDVFAGEKSALFVFKQLRTRKFVHLVPKTRKTKFNHMDFLYGKNVKLFFYKPLLKVLRKL